MRRGFSLVEMLVTSTVSLVVVGLLYVMLVAGMRLYRQGSTRSELQVTAMLSLTRLGADLDKTTPAGVSVRSDGLSLVPLRGISADGRQLWLEELVLYHHVPLSRQLVRRRCPPVPEDYSLALDPTRPLTLTEEELETVFLAESPTPTIIARDVVHFEVSRPSHRLLHVRLGLHREDGLVSFELRRELFLRNP